MRPHGASGVGFESVCCNKAVIGSAYATAIMQSPDIDDQSEALAEWVCHEILPHERDLRRWIERSRLPVDADDIIQEAYARIAALGSVGHIENGRAYLFATARSISLQYLRRSQVVRMESLSDLSTIQIEDSQPTQEAVFWSKHEVRRLLTALPERCRRIFLLCRLEGYTHKEAAESLNVSEDVVQKQLARAMKALTTGFGCETDV